MTQITRERSGRSVFLNAYGRSFWQFRPEPTVFIRVIIMKQKLNDAHISELKLIKFLDQSIEPSEREIYPNNENFQHFLNKLTFVG